MIRANYLPLRRHIFSRQTFPIKTDGRLRRPLSAFVAIVVLLACLDAIECVRLHDATIRHSIAMNRLRESAKAVGQLQHIDDERRHLEQLAEAITRLQRSGRDQANRVAWIGNQLPPSLWLSALRIDRGSYVLQGSARQIGSIGAAMIALRDTTEHPRLDTIAGASAQLSSGFRYSMRIESDVP